MIGATAAHDELLKQLRRVIHSRRVLDAIARVPRERFLDPEWVPYAWENRPLPIGSGQTISQPEMVAAMTEALDLRGDERVLEVGSGSGYQTAILAELAREVVSVERVPELVEQARAHLRELGYDNARVEHAGEVLGRPEDAPYDAIIVTAGAPDVPQMLLDQLAPGGRLVIPVGGRTEQELLRVTVRPGKDPKREHMGPCRFVPLLGLGAWPPEQA